MSIEIRKKEKLLQQEQWAYLSTHPSKRLTYFCYDDDDDYNSAITPVLSTEEPIDSLSMGDEHLDTTPATESDKVIKSSVEDLVSIPSESEGIPEHKCDVPFHDNSPPLDVSNDQIEDFSESNNEVSLIDDDSFSIDKIDYVEASPSDSELVSSDVMDIVIPKVRGIDDDIPLTIKDDNLCEKLLNVNLLIATIEALNDNPTPSSDCETKSPFTSLNSLLEETSTFHNSLPEFENFYFDLGEISSGSTTTHSDISLSEYDSFIFEEFVDELAHIISLPEDLPDPGELMSVLNSGVRENLFTTLVNLPIEDDHSPLLAYVVKENLEKDKIGSKPDKKEKQQSDDLKKKLAKNNEAKMVLYHALPKKEYERIFTCKTAKDIWQSLLITHQEESVDSDFARFNTIITSLKALGEGYSILEDLEEDPIEEGPLEEPNEGGMSSVLEWIGWVRLPSVGMDQMGIPTKYWNGSD
nr:hypothetical protein [Tanacetum cinerariifolium]